jgi:L-fuculose-phosphate aldolase
MNEIRQQLAYVGRRMFERRLSDMSGGNISVRQGERIIISPRFSGSRCHWQLEPEDFIEGNVNTDEIINHPMFSREGKAHVAIYRNFPDVMGVIHAHPFHVLPFCSAEKPIEPVLEQTQKFGVIKVAQKAPAHTQDLAQNVIDVFRGQEATIQKQAAAVIIPQHGIIVAGKDILAALDALERIDWNAWCILARRMMD